MNCNENIVQKRLFPRESHEKALFSTMVALKKAFTRKEMRKSHITSIPLEP